MYQVENFESEIERQTRETFLNRNKKVDEWIFKHVVRNLVKDILKNVMERPKRDHL